MVLERLRGVDNEGRNEVTEYRGGSKGSTFEFEESSIYFSDVT